jgi:hypothetical protein
LDQESYRQFSTPLERRLAFSLALMSAAGIAHSMPPILFARIGYWAPGSIDWNLQSGSLRPGRPK